MVVKIDKHIVQVSFHLKQLSIELQVIMCLLEIINQTFKSRSKDIPEVIASHCFTSIHR